MNLPYLRPKRILIIRLSSLGDVVLTTMMIRCLRRKWRKSHIAMMTRESYLPLLEAIPQLDERIGYPTDKAALGDLMTSVKQSEYDTVIDLQNSFRSRKLTAQIRPKSIYRYHRPRFNRWMRINLPSIRKRLSTPIPVALGYLNVVKRLVVKNDGRGTELVIRDGWSASDADNLKGAMLIAPGARHNTKMWQIEKWVELLKQAHASGIESQAIIGGESEFELAGKIVAGLDYKVEILVGKTDLRELTAVIASASVLVTCDSGPMHIASAVGTPVVAIFGPTVPEFGFAPIRCQHEIVQIEGLSCRPCHPHGTEKCPKGHFRCMGDIEVGRVLKAITKIEKSRITV